MQRKSLATSKRRKPLCLAAFPDSKISGVLASDCLIVGVDEVGAGCLAGPLVAAAYAYRLNSPWVSLASDSVPVRIIDSKMLSDKRREEAFQWLECAEGGAHEIVEITPTQIDEINIYQARMLALTLAVQRLLKKVGNYEYLFIGVDGNVVPGGLAELVSPSCKVLAVTKGDQKLFSIAAASIVAKQYRDSLMASLSSEYPHYSWESNVGYPTRDHKQAINDHGPTPLHRRSFNWSL
ncbi:ribonuclease HII [bacterium]|nr:ribonuclease HII [bacterium]